MDRFLSTGPISRARLVCTQRSISQGGAVWKFENCCFVAKVKGELPVSVGENRSDSTPFDSKHG